MALTRRFYPIPPRGGVFAPSIVVFRGADGRLMPWRDCQTLDFIAVPAVRRPRLTTEHRLTPDDAALTVDKMRLMFAAARWAGHDSLVLGAFGNGAFGNPPSHTAELFANVIEEFPYFRRVVFAILTDRNDRHGNLAAYRRVFFSRTHQ